MTPGNCLRQYKKKKEKMHIEEKCLKEQNQYRHW